MLFDILCMGVGIGVTTVYLTVQLILFILIRVATYTITLPITITNWFIPRLTIGIVLIFLIINVDLLKNSLKLGRLVGAMNIPIHVDVEGYVSLVFGFIVGSCFFIVGDVVGQFLGGTSVVCLFLHFWEISILLLGIYYYVIYTHYML